MELRVAFLNCQSHFTIRARAARGPSDAKAYQFKLVGLATALKDLFRPATPDVFGLCEVGSMTAARDILKKFHQRKYDLVWQNPPARRSQVEPKIGLAVCFDQDLLTVEREQRAEMTVPEGRYHWYAVQMRIVSNNLRFWFIVNHWPADIGYGQIRGTWPRAQVAAAVGEFAARQFRKGSGRIVLVGDFNCEPFDPPMTGAVMAWDDRLIGARERSRVAKAANVLPHFYNPMWRHLGELNPYPTASPGDRPPGTFRYNDQWRCLDQILVDRSLITGPDLMLREASIRIVPPRRGGTDHCAIGAVLDYT